MPSPCSPLFEPFTLAAPKAPNNTSVAGLDADITVASPVPPLLLQGVTLKLALAPPNGTAAAIVGALPVLWRANGTTAWGLTIPGALLRQVGARGGDISSSSTLRRQSGCEAVGAPSLLGLLPNCLKPLRFPRPAP
jgi:hypothetical protein